MPTVVQCFLRTATLGSIDELVDSAVLLASAAYLE
ncbi:hypothetical protein FEAC_06650 [Ferrimicrobium acidiphilum DSM 19497]|uniref:Uncharacterized protein n=1 Tax=Ferrimicrobium acidiphilum DSM 19497 TaxID=1121877 RepID=A0A0D8FWQ4_9ACTN|nr:hypothetical protein FEAC_06650 [Ferrimicrobium acidiphilum DSM 19497]